MKSRHLNFIFVPVVVAVLVLLVAAVMGAGAQILYLLLAGLLPAPILMFVMLCFAMIVLSSLVWLSQGKDASIAIGTFCFLVVCTFAVLHWLVSYFQLWPKYTFYVLPIVSAYLVQSLFPNILDGLYDTTKEKQT